MGELIHPNRPKTTTLEEIPAVVAEIRALVMSEAEIRAAGALQLTEEEELELLEQKVARIKAGGKS